MLQFRKNLMETILKSSNNNSLEPLVLTSLKQMIENGTNMHIVARFVQRFEGDLSFELMQQHSKKEQKHLKETLRVIKGISIMDLAPHLKK